MSEKRLVHIVTGETGEYSDHTMWYVSAYDRLEDAEAVASDLNNWLKSLGLHYDQHNAPQRVTHSARSVAVQYMKAIDPEVSVDYTGVGYGVITVPFDAVDRALLTAPATASPSA